MAKNSDPGKQISEHQWLRWSEWSMSAAIYINLYKGKRLWITLSLRTPILFIFSIMNPVLDGLQWQPDMDIWLGSGLKIRNMSCSILASFQIRFTKERSSSFWTDCVMAWSVFFWSESKVQTGYSVRGFRFSKSSLGYSVRDSLWADDEL